MIVLVSLIVHVLYSRKNRLSKAAILCVSSCKDSGTGRKHAATKQLYLKRKATEDILCDADYSDSISLIKARIF